MNFKTIALIAFIGLSGELLAQGQPGENHNKSDYDHQKSRIEKMRTELDLNDDQMKAINAIHDKYRPARQAIKEDGVTDQEKEVLKTLRAKERAEIKPLLSAEQQVKFEQMQQKEHDGGNRNNQK